MNILQVNTYDVAGGAERIALDLLHGYRLRGHGSYLAARAKKGTDPGVFLVPNDTNRNKWSREWLRLEMLFTKNRLKGLPLTCRAFASLGEPRRWWESQLGLEDYDFPGTRYLLEMMQVKPDILHFHNLHGGYFDLRAIPDFSKQIPSVLTLHDEWTYTGHCACTLGCPRWESGCGKCPDLSIPPPVRRDATKYNWQQKSKIYAKSRLYIASPSSWLMNRALKSSINDAIINWKVIPNGIDLSVFQPRPKSAARQELGFPPNAWISLFVGFSPRSSRFKDYGTIESAVTQAASQSGCPHYLVCVGEAGKEQRQGSLVIRFMDYESDRNKLARYYQSADVYLHASHADNFPTTILEAMGCGTPVVATRIGGIPEQVEDGVTGFLVPARDAAAMTERIMRLQEDEWQRKEMGFNALQRVRKHYSLARMVDQYIDWYAEIIRNHKSK
ncbi:MAG: glycosyltransferase [Deltaproteobacteria bacterium]|nr:glycosyltransferase [Deltaproteobacteria bacterium]